MKNYTDESIKLAKAVDIAIESFKKFPPATWSTETVNHIINCYQEFKYFALNPEPKFKKMASLKYIIEDVFTYFQETSGKEVEYFWQQIKSQNLDYKREDKLRKIITRGKINNRIEFDYITDLIVAVEQQGRINKDEARQLGLMLNEFELRKRK